MSRREGKRMDVSVILPEECISHIISNTSPRDACRSSMVSPHFKSAADSDYVWESFLPTDYQQIISNLVSPSSSLSSLSKKDLYLHLCHNPILINNGTMSFSLEKESGKKCYMVGARGLTVVWGETPAYWIWPSLPESRFSEVCELNYVWWLNVKGTIDTKILSPNTTYAVYFVFSSAKSNHGLQTRPIELSVHFEGSEGPQRRRVFLILQKICLDLLLTEEMGGQRLIWVGSSMRMEMMEQWCLLYLILISSTLNVASLSKELNSGQEMVDRYKYI
ncbi:hypothetical protein Q3G72_019735 [Acer saccharum]|nr:hypothetical protein Q3G72_019735 [Acer saccharum]